MYKIYILLSLIFVIIQSAWAVDYNATARAYPQVIAAGISPTKLDLTDSQYDVVALIRPGVSAIRHVSFNDTDGFLSMKMTPAGVLTNGDEIYKLTFAYDRGSKSDETFSTQWGSKPGQFNIVAIDEMQNYSHTYPYLMVGNFPALDNTTQSSQPLNYDTRARFAPQVIMGGYTPAILDYGDDEFDIIAIIRQGKLDIKQVTIKQNDTLGFKQLMNLAGELDNGDKIYKFSFTYPRGGLGAPGDGTISYKDLWGPEAIQFGIQVIDKGEIRSHQFPDIQFGNYPELKN
ncbi:hypothetical protein [Candidatus Marithrix sp. Canyon 246]|uniref:hypothetical protein n=1 Tax=Candidatus Marithrix sp. Canyon 246 TaxID=1827136 RepID=UPI00084A1098|nr:hypothetical protein [Candidatus Marithrix sp. Canyon 246]